MEETRGMSDIGEIGKLRQQIQRLVDADLVLLEDGQWLLAALDGALKGLTGASAAAAQARIEAFISRVHALIETGMLTTGDGYPQIEAAAVLAAWLVSAGEMDG